MHAHGPSSHLTIVCVCVCVAMHVFRRRQWRKQLFQYRRDHMRHLLRVTFDAWAAVAAKVEPPSGLSLVPCANVMVWRDEARKLRAGAKAEDARDEEAMCKSLNDHPANAPKVEPPRLRSTRATDNTPLHIAAQEADEKEVRLLLEAGADPNAINSLGQTPLHLAAQRYSSLFINIVVLLVECGALVGMKDCWGKTALDLAFNPSVRLLLNKHVRRLKRGDFTDYERHLYRENKIQEWSHVSYARLWRMAAKVIHRQAKERVDIEKRSHGPHTPAPKRKRMTAMGMRRHGRSLGVQHMQESERLRYDPWGLHDAPSDGMKNVLGTHDDGTPKWYGKDDFAKFKVATQRAVELMRKKEALTGTGLSRLVDMQAARQDVLRKYHLFTADRDRLLLANCLMRESLGEFHRSNPEFAANDAYRNAVSTAQRLEDAREKARAEELYERERRAAEIERYRLERVAQRKAATEKRLAAEKARKAAAGEPSDSDDDDDAGMAPLPSSAGVTVSGHGAAAKAKAAAQAALSDGGDTEASMSQRVTEDVFRAVRASAGVGMSPPPPDASVPQQGRGRRGSTVADDMVDLAAEKAALEAVVGEIDDTPAVVMVGGRKVEIKRDMGFQRRKVLQGGAHGTSVNRQRRMSTTTELRLVVDSLAQEMPGTTGTGDERSVEAQQLLEKYGLGPKSREERAKREEQRWVREIKAWESVHSEYETGVANADKQLVHATKMKDFFTEALDRYRNDYDLVDRECHLLQSLEATALVRVDLARADLESALENMRVLVSERDAAGSVLDQWRAEMQSAKTAARKKVNAVRAKLQKPQEELRKLKAKVAKADEFSTAKTEEYMDLQSELGDDAPATQRMAKALQKIAKIRAKTVEEQQAVQAVVDELEAEVAGIEAEAAAQVQSTIQQSMEHVEKMETLKEMQDKLQPTVQEKQKKYNKSQVHVYVRTAPGKRVGAGCRVCSVSLGLARATAGTAFDSNRRRRRKALRCCVLAATRRRRS